MSACRLLPRASTGTTSNGSRSPISLHYRRAEDEEEALTMLNAVATRARHEGPVARFGRKVLELRPPVGAHKGTVRTRWGSAASSGSLRGRRHDRSRRFQRRRRARARRQGRGRLGRRAGRATRGRRHRGRRPRRAARAARVALGDVEPSGLAGRRDLFLPNQHQRRDDTDERDAGTDPEREPEARCERFRRCRAGDELVLRPADRDRREQRDPDGAADLLRGVDQARRDPGLVRLTPARAAIEIGTKQSAIPSATIKKPGSRSVA